ncbi:hypothetical protein PHAVU_003G266100 [Phaseolus vulgaris]|uniref:BZIP domain-containing protein n=1 Tax=Phaseolus vulgaris TaxID=3885 RepID=V7CDD6_PHAVU|nr:hypothetical protein PHAVU_003G266100g [Phaseolus vulgaris]ESW28187.1 hypothetical protein PHAVU_003G266100g [Phaseolus vulgaris]
MEDVWNGINSTALSEHNTTHISKGAKFQDFLAGPFNPSPVTALTLSTRSSEYLPLHKDLQLLHTASKTEPFAHPFSNERAPPASRDMRNARLMKNRESAARSRARKQAYLIELKQKIEQLQEENARLIRQQQLLRETATNQWKRGNLSRTYTAPF